MHDWRGSQALCQCATSQAQYYAIVAELRGTLSESEIMTLGSQIIDSFLAYQLHFVVQISGWKGVLEPGK